MTNVNTKKSRHCRNNANSSRNDSLHQNRDTAIDCSYTSPQLDEEALSQQIEDNLNVSLHDLPNHALEPSTIVILKLIAKYRAKQDYLKLSETGNQPYANDNEKGAA